MINYVLFHYRDCNLLVRRRPVTVGSDVFVRGTPFGDLKPALFINSVLVGCVSGVCSDGELFTTDCCLPPGCEGAPVFCRNTKWVYVLHCVCTQVYVCMCFPMLQTSLCMYTYLWVGMVMESPDWWVGRAGLLVQANDRITTIQLEHTLVNKGSLCLCIGKEGKSPEARSYNLYFYFECIQVSVVNSFSYTPTVY